MDLFKEFAEKCKPHPTTEELRDLGNKIDAMGDAMDDQCRADLREMMMFYGSWEALRKVIKELEDNDKDAAWERHNNDY